MKKNFLPVNIAVSDSLNYARIFIRYEELNNKAIKRSNIDIPDFKHAKLAYFSFHLENYFYIDSILQSISLGKNQVI